jgi:hypothetical protein
VAAVVVVVAVLPLGLHYRALATYDGLGSGGYRALPRVPGEVPYHETSTANFGTETTFEYRPGGRIVIGFNLFNFGKRSVHVTALPMEAYFADRVITRIGDGGQSDRNGGTPDHTIAFRPFTLKPHAARYYEFELVLRDCPVRGSGGGSSWHTQRVRYTVGGLRRSGTVGLPGGVAVTGLPGICGPGR